MDIIEDSELEKKPIIITEKCEKQLDEAIKYIEQYSEKQAAIMRSQFFNILKILEQMPKIGTKYKNGIRKIRLGKFRYNIYYIEFNEFISIRGIWHTSRGTEFEG